MTTFHRIAGLAFCGFLGALPHLSAQTKDIVELYGGYVYNNTTTEAVVPTTGLSGFVVGIGAFAYHSFGASFEVSKQYGTEGASAGSFSNANLHLSSYMAGPHFRFLNTKRVNATAKALLGGVQGQVFQPGSQESQTRFALMMGANVDFGITRILAFRVEPGLYRTSFDHQNQNSFRISIGPVLRFGHE